MPLHFEPTTRRRFLGTAALAGCGWLTRFDAPAADNGPQTFALLSDTHIAADPATIARETDLCGNLRSVVAEVKAARSPAAVLLNGDIALNEGRREDYEQVLKELAPLMGEGAPPLHMNMGNHDDRENFRAVVRPRASSPLTSKHVALVRGRDVNWFMLDTLRFTNKVEGELGAEQLTWLAAALKEHAGKPAVVIGHHNPQFPAAPPPGGAANPGATNEVKVSGLMDTMPLVSLLEKHPNVKAYVYGHTHNWAHERRPSGLHLINLPPVAYVFKKDRPNGWVEASTESAGAVFRLHALDKQHPEEGATVEVAFA